MKSILQFIKSTAVLIIALISMISHAQQGVNYQGVARNSEGNVITDTEIELGININKSTADGDTVYSETHTTLTDANGVFSIVIGQGVSISTIENIDWSETNHFLNVWLDGEEVGTTEFMSVPYAKAIGKWQAHKNGVTPKGTGGSVYIGENAGELDDFSDNHNIGIGENALARTNNSTNNIAIGKRAMRFNDTGGSNIALGYEALTNNSTGSSNTAIGGSTLQNNISGAFNTAIGRSALESNTDGDYNIGIGFASLNSNTTGDNNIANGHYALSNNLTGSSNIAFGNAALYDNTTGYGNFAAGYRSLWKNTTGNSNVAIGGSTLYNNTTGIRNVAIGRQSLYSNTIGNYNSAFGYQTLENNTIGSYNVASGYRSLNNNTTGNNNVAFGQDALYSNTTGYSNIAIGFSALGENIADVSNIAIGTGSLRLHNNGNTNVSVGSYSLNNHISGAANVAIGGLSLDENISGELNTAIGHRSGGDTMGSRNVFIGAFSGTHSIFENQNDILVIENTSSSNTLIYGEFDNNILSFGSSSTKVGVNTKTPSVPLHLRGGSDVTLSDASGIFVIGSEAGGNLAMDNNEIQARNNGATSDLNLQAEGGDVRVGGAIVHASDRRLKRNIKDISFGLNDILKLRPTEYFWKGKTQDDKSLGLIAQEVNDVIKNVVTYDEDSDKYGVSYTELIPVLIKAIQEQQLIIQTQQKRNNRQTQELSDLNSRIELIESKLLQLN